MPYFPEYVMNVINMLESNGFEAFAVGGCVRDIIMDVKPHDYDITTDALPCQIKDVFSKYRIVTDGEKHGTVTVITEGHPVEITTYRTDGSYTDSRRPDNVLFSRKLEDDLKRRDFTMNAMAMDKNGNITDIFGGRRDIGKKIIRAVGNPSERLMEDALRIMRCVRFSSQLGFQPEEELSFALSKHRELLKKISAERIREEFTKLLCGKNCTEVLRAYKDIIEVFIPEIKPMYGFCQHTKYHRFDVWEHTIRAVGNGKSAPLMRTALFFHDIAKPDCFTMDENGTGHFKRHAPLSAEKAEAVMKRLKYSSKDIENTKKLVTYHRLMYKTDGEIKRVMNKTGYDLFLQLLELKRADDSAKGYYDVESSIRLELAKKRAEEIIRNGECYRLKDMKINGNDLLQMGISGKKIGYILDIILEKIIDGELKNCKTDIENCVKSLV